MNLVLRLMVWLNISLLFVFGTEKGLCLGLWIVITILDRPLNDFVLFIKLRLIEALHIF